MQNNKYEKAKKIIRQKEICKNTVDSQIFMDMLINWEYISKSELEKIIENGRKKY